MIWSCARTGCFDNAIYAHVQRQHPQYVALTRLLQARRRLSADSWAWKEAPSETRKFVASTLAAIAAQPCFSDLSKHRSFSTPECGKHEFTEVIGHEHKLWNLPTEDDITAMADLVGPENRVDAPGWTNVRYRARLKCQFSAATMAIHFLDTLSSHTQLQIRKIVLHEDNRSIAWPECHAQGLIPFCQHNPKLRIVRRVDL